MSSSASTAAGRRHAVPIDAPFAAGLKMQLVRGITRALTNPARSLPSLRKNIVAATSELRVHGLDDARIRALFARIIEDVARDRGFDATSVLSGKPRWAELADRANEWMEAISR